jgi:RNA polymerase sigma factor (sigma-70 family)
MPDSSTHPSPAEMTLLATVIRDVARMHRLAAADVQDFGQTVQLRFLERGYDVFARFDGRSTLRTYLSVVVTRLLLDWRNATYGKWRPSAAAVRLGRDAVRLDRLINRDGYSRDAAAEIVQRLTGSAPAHIRAIADHLPVKCRRRFVEPEAARFATAESFHDPIEAQETRVAARRARRALANAYRQLDPEERRLIALRYQRALSVQEIGRVLQMDPKPLYRRFERVVHSLRIALRETGVTEVSASR